MKPLFTVREFNETNSRDFLSCECYTCGNAFLSRKSSIVQYLNNNPDYAIKFCSNACKGFAVRQSLEVICKNCNKTIFKSPKEIKGSKSGNNFCSRSCAASFNNKHKTKGTRRSKLEIWLENELKSKYSNLNFYFNDSSIIGSELDIYIPELNVAFELNGIFHYEPIYGINKLQSIQNNDFSKSKICHDLKIDLCVIDTSHQIHFTEKSSEQYLKIITDIIDKRSTDLK